jgi:TPP-dependent indolepyruvate ferredoxin oxidoreductase alpha subunit
MCLDFLRGLDEALVVEELDPVIERELVYLCGRHRIGASVRGKLTGHMPCAGENSPASVKSAILAFLASAAATVPQAAGFGKAANAEFATPDGSAREFATPGGELPESSRSAAAAPKPPDLGSASPELPEQGSADSDSAQPGYGVPTAPAPTAYGSEAAGQTASGQYTTASAGQAVSGQAATASVGQAASGRAATASVGQAASGHATATSAGQTASGRAATASAGQAASGQCTATSAGQAASGQAATASASGGLPPLAVRPPVLCAGCPHRASFFAAKEAVRGRKAVFSGDIGCYTLGNAMPLDMVDTCLCMGAGIAQAQGIHRIAPDALNFAFIGDSTFFHTGIPGIVNAVFNKADIIVAVLDNATTAMTGGQPNPGMGKTLMGEAAPKISICGILSAIGVDSLQRVSAFDFGAAVAAVKSAAEKKGVRAIVFEGPCISLAQKGKPLKIDEAACTGCGACARRLGCPAISSQQGKKPAIDALLCTGCGLCANLCKFGAIAAPAA